MFAIKGVYDFDVIDNTSLKDENNILGHIYTILYIYIFTIKAKETRTELKLKQIRNTGKMWRLPKGLSSPLYKDFIILMGLLILTK